jgi:hypothetical protein
MLATMVKQSGPDARCLPGRVKNVGDVLSELLRLVAWWVVGMDGNRARRRDGRQDTQQARRPGVVDGHCTFDSGMAEVEEQRSPRCSRRATCCPDQRQIRRLCRTLRGSNRDTRLPQQEVGVVAHPSAQRTGHHPTPGLDRAYGGPVLPVGIAPLGSCAPAPWICVLQRENE